MLVAAAVITIGLPVKVAHAGPSGTSVALLLVIPVVAVALRASRRVAYAAAVVAALVLSLLLPPVGTFTVHLTDDLVALVVFLVVALAVGRLVSGRVELLGRIEVQRDALLRSVSHDLRTPLAGIRAAASELGSDVEHDAATRATLLHVVEQEAERLDRLVANLLSLSRSRAGAFVPERRPVDVEELLLASAERLGRLAGPVTIDVRVDPDLPEVPGDYGQLDQLVTNLLENAVRHSPPGGTVHLTAALESDELVVGVGDEGPGVPEAERAAIFEPFRSGATPGASGLGLAICRAVAEGHCGTIAVDGRGGGGAQFVVRIPAR